MLFTARLVAAHATLASSGDVGLPEGEMDSSDPSDLALGQRPHNHLPSYRFWLALQYCVSRPGGTGRDPTPQIQDAYFKTGHFENQADEFARAEVRFVPKCDHESLAVTKMLVATKRCTGDVLKCPGRKG